MSDGTDYPTGEEWDFGDDAARQDDPLLDALMVLAKLHGRQVTRAGLTAGLPLENNRLTVSLFSRAAQRAFL
ncbi:MAG: hypothetical protein HGB35_07865 [Geobacteraceae bacterium]|nr:hypothetical protein [Geobacteraceae bacterium]